MPPSETYRCFWVVGTKAPSSLEQLVWLEKTPAAYFSCVIHYDRNRGKEKLAMDWRTFIPEDFGVSGEESLQKHWHVTLGFIVPQVVLQLTENKGKACNDESTGFVFSTSMNHLCSICSVITKIGISWSLLYCNRYQKCDILFKTLSVVWLRLALTCVRWRPGWGFAPAESPDSHLGSPAGCRPLQRSFHCRVDS